MTDDVKFQLQLTNPGELVAAMPYWLGSYPSHALVLVTLAGASANRLRGMVRMDLPTADQHEACASRVLTAVRRHGAAAAVLVVVGEGQADLPASLPQPDLVTVIQRTLAAEGTAFGAPVWTAATTADSPWQCYDDPRYAGRVPRITADLPTPAVREDLVASLAPPDPTTSARRARQIQDLATDQPAIAQLNQALGLPPGIHHMPAFELALTAAKDGELQLGDREVAKLAVALDDPAIWLVCMEMSTTSHAAGAEALWHALTKASPADCRQSPATLLGICAYLRGDVALADVATEIAERSSSSTPGLAGALRLCVSTRFPPKRLAATISGMIDTVDQL